LSLNKLLRIIFVALTIILLSNPAICDDKVPEKDKDEHVKRRGRRVKKEVADRLLAFQNDNGGWLKNYKKKEPVDSKRNKKVLKQKGNSNSTIDNGATHSEIRYLSRAYLNFKDKKYKKAVCKGVEYLLDAQYDNGGWPQFYPYRKDGYNRYITFNDDAMIGAMRVLRDISEGKEPFKFFDKDTRKRAGKAVKKGIECILKCQVVVDGKKTVWCAQHDEKSYEPRKARSYELASLSGSESVGIVHFLMEIEKPSKEITEAIESAVAWFEEAKIEGIKLKVVEDEALPEGKDEVVVKDSSADPLWARFYDIETNKPIFCDRGGKIKNQLSDISHERRNGYSWLGPYANELLHNDYPKWAKTNN